MASLVTRLKKKIYGRSRRRARATGLTGKLKEGHPTEKRVSIESIQSDEDFDIVFISYNVWKVKYPDMCHLVTFPSPAYYIYVLRNIER